ncbi:hypothetical protein [Desulfurobacterium crinifex]
MRKLLILGLITLTSFSILPFAYGKGIKQGKQLNIAHIRIFFNDGTLLTTCNKIEHSIPSQSITCYTRDKKLIIPTTSIKYIEIPLKNGLKNEN